MQAYRITSPAELQEAFAIRTAVFVDEQQVPREAENDEHDHTDAIHYLARADDGTPCGAARWRPTNQGVKLERFAVLAPYRSQAAGAALVTQVLQDVAAAYPNATVYLHAQLPAVRFYERHGFVKDGPQFTECDIEHYKMRWQRP
ncbi:GNAT family N-acetyltransferase [Hymenobacter lutimineralis]|uniref:GNAT family N-acetyltransferase n=1 Tax=Hymenobacter lutimineralis TaxID=2606448 RepID=A0A5D6UX95_9BACT|nr:GNAT family N-acetyltransferase [Hymenobacter lutimineralis]TYZ07617.1 GNAT family N-acetyltransferase [Hymenobacter lutimineralis]